VIHNHGEGEGQAYIGLVILDLTVPAKASIAALFPVGRQTLKGSQNIFFFLQYVHILCTTKCFKHRKN
jgi:hypothetical protein